MRQTTVQINAMMSSFSDAGAGRQIKRRDDVGRVDANLPSGTATVRAAGHEGHVMPMPPAVNPVKEKIKPKTPPTPPATKPPAKKAQSRLCAARSHRERWCKPATGASRGSIPARIGSARNPCPGWKNEALCISPTHEATRSA